MGDETDGSNGKDEEIHKQKKQNDWKSKGKRRQLKERNEHNKKYQKPIERTSAALLLLREPQTKTREEEEAATERKGRAKEKQTTAKRQREIKEDEKQRKWRTKCTRGR